MSVACLLLDSGAGLGYVQVFLIMYAHCLWLAISVAGETGDCQQAVSPVVCVCWSMFVYTKSLLAKENSNMNTHLTLACHHACRGQA
jgi:hypothetical protein